MESGGNEADVGASETEEESRPEKAAGVLVLVQKSLKERGDWQVAPLLTQFNLQLLLLSGTSFSLRLQRKPKLNQNLKQSYQGNKMGELGIRKHITHTLSNSEQKQSYFGTYGGRKGQLALWADAGCGLLAFV